MRNDAKVPDVLHVCLPPLKKGYKFTALFGLSGTSRISFVKDAKSRPPCSSKIREFNHWPLISGGVPIWKHNFSYYICYTLRPYHFSMADRKATLIFNPKT